ncbi:asparagine synthase-related protein [Natronococcus roseus]|uniref:asparagine synthase-related protein n=1 Tax=Natronococcus roseus TaxID=1052014 RepID=UPI00374C9462
MVGICGSFGSGRSSIEPLADALLQYESEDVTRYDGDDASVHVALHAEHDQPARAAGGDVLLWVWGELYGFDGPDGYVPRTRAAPNRSDAEYCAELYDRYGLGFVHGLNSEFAGIVYDRRDRTVSLFVDRLSSRPLFYARTEDGGLVVSTLVQSVADHPAVGTALDLEALCEFFAFERVLGVKTPFEGIESVHPGSVLTYDVSGDTYTTDTYWRPEYRPRERPYSQVVDEFITLFERVMGERIDDDERYGLLLSGGSDSRLLLAALKDATDVVCYHMNEYPNAEATAARRVADTAGVEFEFLRRGTDYQAALLERSAPRSNFASWFDQAHTAGFSERLRDEQDILLTGLYADTLLNGFFTPQRTIELPALGWEVELPYETDVHTVRELADRLVAIDRGTGIPEFVTVETTPEACIANNLKLKGNTVTSHGVEYPSLTKLVEYQNYPLSSDGAFLMYETLYRTLPTRDPFLDNRLVEFALRLPTSVLFRRNLVNDGLTRLAPDLAAVPHPETGIGLQHPWVMEYLLTYVTGLRDELFASEPHPGPWTNRAVAIRESDFVIETIRRHESTIRNCPFLDYDGIVECYREHLAGADRMPALYPLVTILEAPALRRRLARPSVEPLPMDPTGN